MTTTTDCRPGVAGHEGIISEIDWYLGQAFDAMSQVDSAYGALSPSC